MKKVSLAISQAFVRRRLQTAEQIMRPRKSAITKAILFNNKRKSLKRKCMFIRITWRTGLYFSRFLSTVWRETRDKNFRLWLVAQLILALPNQANLTTFHYPLLALQLPVPPHPSPAVVILSSSSGLVRRRLPCPAPSASQSCNILMFSFDHICRGLGKRLSAQGPTEANCSWTSQNKCYESTCWTLGPKMLCWE